jgi:hypothetical protein
MKELLTATDMLQIPQDSKKQRQHTRRTDTKYKAYRFQREDKHIYEAENQNNFQKQIDRETERVRGARCKRKD